MSEFDNVVQAVRDLLGKDAILEVDASDPRMGPILREFKKAKVKLALTNAGFCINLPKPGNTTLRVFKIGAGVAAMAAASTQTVAPPAPVQAPVQASAPAPTPAVAPESKGEPVPAVPAPRPAPKRHQHTYRPPAFLKDVIDVLADDASHVVWLKGPTGSGKTVAVAHIARAMGKVLFRLNCNPAMGPESFMGEKTIDIDPATAQNFVRYARGVVVNAMTCGLDDEGNEVGVPGLLYIDEAGAMPQQVSILLNRLLESDDPRRTVCLDLDGGRVVRSHSKFRIVLAANNVGRGCNTIGEQFYTAQTSALDLSLLNRVTCVFNFGYDREVEKGVLMEKINNDKAVRDLVRFRDEIRKHLKAGKLQTPLSTRKLIDVANLWRIFRDLPKAIWLACVEQLLPDEVATYQEQMVALFGRDMRREMEGSGVDYF